MTACQRIFGVTIVVGVLCMVVDAGPAHGSLRQVVSPDDAEATKEWLRHYLSSINAGDLAAFESLWAAGADWAPPDAPVIHGRQAITDFVRPTFEKYAMDYAFTSQSFKVVEGFGVAMISTTDRYTPRTGDGAPWEEKVKGVVLMRRDDQGSWVATYFVWNRDAPPGK